jgi:hypothetical protein
MDLMLREEYSKKICMKLIAVIFHCNYYSFIAFLRNWYDDTLFH